MARPSVVSLALLVPLLSCGDANPSAPSTPPPTAPAARPFDGTWGGITSQGRPVGVKVVDGNIVEIAYGVDWMDQSACRATSGIAFYSGHSCTIGSTAGLCNRLARSYPVAADGSFEFNDRFGGATTAFDRRMNGSLTTRSGALEVSDTSFSACRATVTWQFGVRQ